MNKKHFAEIIESSLACWRACSWHWDYAPAFGSLVTLKNKDRDLFGIVHQIEFGSSDPTRQPYAYQKTEQELRAEQPQIFEFLMTNFLIAPVGYLEDNTMFYQLPPLPPKIHSFVAHTNPEEEALFFSDPSYLHTLFGLSGLISHLDELLLALLKNAAKKQLPAQTIKKFIETFSQQAQSDYNRVRLFCARAQQLLGNSYV